MTGLLNLLILWSENKKIMQDDSRCVPRPWSFSSGIMAVFFFAPKSRNLEENAMHLYRSTHVNPFTTGNPFLATKLLGFSKGRGSGALKGLRIVRVG